MTSPAKRQLQDILRDYATQSSAKDLRAEYTVAFKELFNRKGWKGKFSELFITIRISKLANDIASTANSEQAKKLLNDWLRDLDNYQQQHVVYVPIVGLILTSDAAYAGVNILKFDGQNLPREIAIGFEQKEPEIKSSYLFELNADRVSAFVPVTSPAEPRLAQAIADDLVSIMLDFIRFAAYIKQGPFYLFRLGLQGEFGGAIKRTVLVRDAAQLDLNLLNTIVDSTFDPIVLDDELISVLDELGATDIIKKVMSGSQLTEIERMLQTAVHWYGVGQTQRETDNQLLALIISLESLAASTDPSEPAAMLIAENVALIAGATPEERLAIRKRIKTVLYKRRSSIAHGRSASLGRSDLIDYDIVYARRLAEAMIVECLKRRDQFKTRVELREWFEGLRMGMPRTDPGLSPDKSL